MHMILPSYVPYAWPQFKKSKKRESLILWDILTKNSGILLVPSWEFKKSCQTLKEPNVFHFIKSENEW